ncbi:hypothetical protein LIER_07036 [Lithospermum erythrorhizon]|uniref:Uncharacterized protein n=1 Tax=Lithospermum erythrorhizon TaxID=34254 RepID=A0AAV3P6T1_LITER
MEWPFSPIRSSYSPMRWLVGLFPGLVLKKENAREEGVLHRRLKNLVGEHTTLQEKYRASVRHTEAVRAALEGVQVERGSAMKERDIAVKERYSLHACKD